MEILGTGLPRDIELGQKTNDVKGTLRRAPVVLVGAFPPPLHGMAAVNAAVREALERAGIEPWTINLAAPNLNRLLVFRLRRLPRVLHGLSILIGARRLRGASLYISVSGGLGQIYDILFAIVARLRGMRLFLHHHSFAYIDKRSPLTAWLARVAGGSAVQVTLSPRMAERLKALYRVRCVFPVSNSVILLGREIPLAEPRRRLHTLGFISNIAAEKGVFEFLDLLDRIRDLGMPLCAKLAGPFQNRETERMVRARLPSLPNLKYVGPKYGTEKDTFFASIDALVFPTHYANEAEPLTLHEAMSRGVPVVAYGRGAIPEILDVQCGKVIDPVKPFVPVALAQIRAWLDAPAAFEKTSRAAIQCFAETYALNERRWQVLLRDLAGSLDSNAQGCP